MIVAYNNADTVGACVDSVLRQDYANRETIVISDAGSTDGTRESLAKIQAASPEGFELVTVPHTGRSAARNVGWGRGKGNIVFFADADDVYHPDYLAKAVEAFAGENVGCVCVTGASLIEGNGMAPRMLKLYSLVQVKSRAESRFKPSWAWVYSRRALEATGGFDERLDQAEDKDLFERVRKLDFEVALVDGIHWLHRRPDTNAKYFRKTLNGGASRVAYLAKHKDSLGFVRATGILWYLCIAVAVEILYPPALLVVVAALLAALLYRGVAMASMVWRDVAHKSDLLLYPFFALASHTVAAVGCLIGLVRYMASPPRPTRRAQ